MTHTTSQSDFTLRRSRGAIRRYQAAAPGAPLAAARGSALSPDGHGRLPDDDPRRGYRVNGHQPSHFSDHQEASPVYTWNMSYCIMSYVCAATVEGLYPVSQEGPYPICYERLPSKRAVTLVQ